eukprot:symbB.v1.2.020447.t1/scaffold1720.1/size104783/1
MRDQLPALFPYLFGGRPTSLPRPIYTPQEHFIYTQVYEAAHFTPRLPDDHYLRHEAQGVLLKTYLWTVIPARYTSLEMAQLPNGQFAQGIRLPEALQSNFLEHGLGMINFCMNLRSCICFNLWGVWMGLQEHLQQGLGAQLPDHLNDAFVYVALRLEAGRVHNGLQDGTWRMWNRRYCDFFLHSAQDVHFTQLELSTARVYFTGKFKSSYCASLLYHLTPRQSTYHPETGHFRFYHAFLQSEVKRLHQSGRELQRILQCRGEFVYEVAVTPKGEGAEEPSGKSATFTLCALAQHPYIQIADLRTESATLQPQSMMWTQFQVDGINELYKGEVVDVERKFQNCIGIDEKKRLVRRGKSQVQLKPFQLLFGTSAVESRPTVVYLALSNPGYLPIRFSFQTPENLNLENVPYWCDEKALVDEREAHFTWVEEHGVYDIQPRTGAIAPGDFLHVKFTYHHHSIGTHILPVVFNVHDGRSVLFYLKGHSVAPNVGCLSVRSSVLSLQPVPLGVDKGVVQAVELTNSGGVTAPWRVDLSTISAYNAENHNFEVLSVKPLEGTLAPQSSTFLHFTFRPLEAKRYTCPVRLEMLKDGRPSEELCFDIEADGYIPGDLPPQVEPQFPPNLPIQTYAPVPGYGAALSIEILDFKEVPLRARQSQMLVLVNYTSDFVLSFKWDARKLFRFDHELEIEPSFGELSPGSHCIVVFRLCCDEPVDLSGEIACYLDWTHISAYGQQSIVESQEDPGAEVEYFAFHADHIHEPTRNGKGQNAPVHISVANRLTVSRFRNLMSTAAGQKFLNENLHRTSVLSSHIPVMSPRRAMQTSTMGLALQSKEELPGMQSSSSMEESSHGPQLPSAPTSYPLYVRLRAVVADWMVKPEERKDFVVESCARNLLAQRVPAVEEPKDETNPLNLHLEEPGSKDFARAPSTLSPAPEEEEMEPPGQPIEETSNFKLAGSVLEHLMREVIAEEEFGNILDKMLAQDVPFFQQFENSSPPELPPPDHPAAPESALRPRQLEESVEELAVEPEEESDEDVDFSARGSALPWSDLLMNFNAPEGIPAPKAPAKAPKGTESVPSASPSPRAESLSFDAEISGEQLTRSWEEGLEMYGEVDLDAFQDSAQEVLDQLLLDTMDDVIAGRLNWMRPLPRVRERRL